MVITARGTTTVFTADTSVQTTNIAPATSRKHLSHDHPTTVSHPFAMMPL